jgi:hypothetical protein
MHDHTQTDTFPLPQHKHSQCLISSKRTPATYSKLSLISKSNPTKAQSHKSQVVLTHSAHDITHYSLLCLSRTPISSTHHGLPPSHQLSPPTPTTTEFLPPPRLTFSKLNNKNSKPKGRTITES